MQIEIQTALIAGLFAILGSATTLYLQHGFTKEQRKQIELSKLEGLKILRQQLYLSRFEAFVYSDYHEFRNKIDPNALDLSEAKRWMEKSENLALEIAKVNQKFLENLGLITALFPNSNDINRLIDENRTFKSPNIKRPTLQMSKTDLEDYKVKVIEELKKMINQEYGEKVERLIKKLKKYI